MQAYPHCNAILVRRHGVYVWGETWQKAKTMCECYDYLFEIAVKMKLAGLDPAAVRPAPAPPPLLLCFPACAVRCRRSLSTQPVAECRCRRNRSTTTRWTRTSNLQPNKNFFCDAAPHCTSDSYSSFSRAVFSLLLSSNASARAMRKQQQQQQQRGLKGAGTLRALRPDLEGAGHACARDRAGVECELRHLQLVYAAAEKFCFG
jgi:hypothetical protein